MSIIKIMSENLSNKIAAGEVVETLMNVVKELTENSIDAKADEIRIDLIDSGIKEVKVSDNGVGMDKNDALNCLERHATSKLYDDEDLFNINTLGFRGEALPSIASVSKMTIKTSNEDVGTIIYVEGGTIKKIEESDLRCGTTITVNEIFYNTPARLKYLKSLNSELANIISYVNKMALANPNIKFTLTNNAKELLKTDGSGNLLKVINSIYGLEVTKKMCKFENENDDYYINGYFSYPEINRSSRNFITLLINGRNVRNNEIIKTILEAYHTYLPINRYPIVVLNIETDSSIIDVNIHPTKMDVKFSKLDELKELIYNTISINLEKLTLIPEAKYEDRPISNIEKVTTVNNDIDFKDKEIVKPEFEVLNFDFSVNEEEIPYIKEEIDTKEEPRFKMIEVLALVHGTYIVGENEDGMYIIDQHAANERINYEYYKEKLGKETNELTDLLVPIKIELSNNEYILLKKHFDILDRLNFKYEEFGFNSIIIRSHPTWITKEEQIRKIIEVIINSEDFSLEKFNEKIAITLACKMSIKANEHISLEEMRELVVRLSKTKNPFTCPHGRPTTIIHTKYELEKMFKRVM